MTMTEKRIHRAVSADGTEIVGRVAGQGPALVLLHAGLEDGDLWEHVLPHLTGRFICSLPSTRGRGLSGDNPDRSPPRLVEDVGAFADSIGAPVFLAGESMGAHLALAAAERAGAVTAVPAWEPFVSSVMREEARPRVPPQRRDRRRARRRRADGRLRPRRAQHPGAAAGSPAGHGVRGAALVRPGRAGEDHRAGAAPARPGHRPWDLLHRRGAPRGRARRRRRVRVSGLGHLAWVLAPERIADELLGFFDAAANHGTVAHADSRQLKGV